MTLLLHSFEFVVGGIGANHKADYECCSKVLTQLDKLVLESFKFSVVCLIVGWAIFRCDSISSLHSCKYVVVVRDHLSKTAQI